MSGFHVKYVGRDSSFYMINALPFMPDVTQTAETEYEIKFNEAYVFDYANGARKLAVQSLTHNVNQGEVCSFKLKLTIDKQTGRISYAQIIKGENSSDFNNLYATSTWENPLEASYAGQDGHYYVDLAEFNGPDLSEIYLRDNLHLHFRGFAQRGAEYGQEDVGPVMMPDESFNANGLIKFRSLAKDPREDNCIEISVEDDKILLYSPCTGSSGS
jgi:hypothetical protein